MRNEDASSRLDLPAGFCEFPDPCGPNPFPPNSSQHRAWAEATAVAAAEVAQIRAGVLGRLSTSSPQSGTLWDVANAEREARLAIFDAWATRGLTVVTSEAAAAGFAGWLVSYANGFLRLWVEHHASFPADYPVDTLGTALRNGFAARVEHWKSEAIKRLAGPGPADELPAITVTEPMKAYRKRLVREYRRRNGMTMEELSREVGMSETAIRAIWNETPGRYSRDTQARLLERLGVTRAAWYSKR